MRPIAFMISAALLALTAPTLGAQPEGKGPPGDRGGGGGGGSEEPAQPFDAEIAYVWRDNKGAEIRFASRDGNTEAVVHRTGGPNIHAIDLSSDASDLIAFSTGDGVFLIRWLEEEGRAEAPVQIHSGIMHFVDFDPDDEKLLFSDGPQLFVHTINHGDLSQGTTALRDFPGEKFYPRWSPDRSGAIYHFGADELRRHDPGADTATTLRAPNDGYGWHFGLDTTRPRSVGTPMLVAGQEVGVGEYEMRLFNLDGSAVVGHATVKGTDFHFDCSNNYVLHHHELGRNDALAITRLGGTPTTWKKDSRIRTPVTDWQPCG